MQSKETGLNKRLRSTKELQTNQFNFSYRSNLFQLAFKKKKGKQNKKPTWVTNKSTSN